VTGSATNFVIVEFRLGPPDPGADPLDALGTAVMDALGAIEDTDELVCDADVCTNAAGVLTIDMQVRTVDRLFAIRHACSVARRAMDAANATVGGGHSRTEEAVTVTACDYDQAWYWTAEWQDRERGSRADYEAGRFTTLDSDADFLDHLQASREGRECAS
jgi:hypothetical protein